MSTFKEIEWDDLSQAIPAFMASIVMGFVYNISYGIAAGFIFYCLIKLITGKVKGNPSGLSHCDNWLILNFVILASL